MSERSTTLRSFEAPDDPALIRALRLAFAGTDEGVVSWLDQVGREHVRLLGDPLRAALIRVPMGMFLGGRSVPLVGIAGVGVAPEDRGQGHARALMEGCVRELAAEGVALSALYASTQPLYRSVGYERAGGLYEVTLPLRDIPYGRRGAPLVALGPDDEPAIHACYGSFAKQVDGMLDRGPQLWARTRQHRGLDFEAFGVRSADGARLDGYARLAQKRDPSSGRHDVVLSDLAFLTEAAGRRLLAFFADFATVGSSLRFLGWPSHPMLALPDHARETVSMREAWMLRVVDVQGALEGRGYPAGLRTAFGLELTDAVVSGNEGRWVVEIEDGAAAVRRGGGSSAPPTVVGDVRGLAALLTGFMAPSEVARISLIDGPDDAMQRVGAAFAGTGSAMVDPF